MVCVPGSFFFSFFGRWDFIEQGAKKYFALLTRKKSIE